jgi:hypothetical protein
VSQSKHLILQSAVRAPPRAHPCTRLTHPCVCSIPARSPPTAASWATAISARYARAGGVGRAALTTRTQANEWLERKYGEAGVVDWCKL